MLLKHMRGIPATFWGFSIATGTFLGSTGTIKGFTGTIGFFAGTIDFAVFFSSKAGLGPLIAFPILPEAWFIALLAFCDR
jgi:hypothetical protein